MSGGRDALVFARDVTGHLRALLLACSVSEGLAALLETTEETASRYRAAARRAQPAQLMRIMDLFIAAESDMRWASLPRTVLELCAARACQPEGELGMEALAERVGRLESGMPIGRATDEAPTHTETPPQAQLPVVRLEPEASVADDAISSVSAQSPEESALRDAPVAAPARDDALGVYEQGLALLRKQAMSAYVQLARGVFKAIEGDVLDIQFEKSAAIYKQSLEQPAALAAIGTAMAEAFGRRLSIRLSIAGEAPSEKPAKPSMDERRTLGEIYDFFSRENVEIVDE